MEGLHSLKAIPNLDIKFRGLNYTAIYLPYLNCCPLITSKTFYYIFIFETKTYKIIVYTFYLYYNPKTANKAILI